MLYSNEGVSSVKQRGVWDNSAFPQFYILEEVSLLTVSLVCSKSCRGIFLADRGCPNAEVFVWGRGEYGRLGLGDRSGSSKLRATQVHFREPDIKIVQVLELLPPLPGSHLVSLALLQDERPVSGYHWQHVTNQQTTLS